ncbi:unnamed protein product [Lactuca virosa]|uniref:Transmembrane protein n=1 Tax=Lactuca virosa TaxID=75947 RepID=A0AAU9PSG6_9ASTR|nr:unnamed protein product [Lactuca virosa]
MPGHGDEFFFSLVLPALCISCAYNFSDVYVYVTGCFWDNRPSEDNFQSLPFSSVGCLVSIFGRFLVIWCCVVVIDSVFAGFGPGVVWGEASANCWLFPLMSASCMYLLLQGSSLSFPPRLLQSLWLCFLSGFFFVLCVFTSRRRVDMLSGIQPFLVFVLTVRDVSGAVMLFLPHPPPSYMPGACACSSYRGVWVSFFSSSTILNGSIMVRLLFGMFVVTHVAISHIGFARVLMVVIVVEPLVVLNLTVPCIVDGIAYN